MKSYIYLVRHGETQYGNEKRYLGHTNCELSVTGKKQAVYLAEVFEPSNVPIDHIFSSDLIRCKKTIQTVFPDRAIIYSDLLREINMGIWDGLTFDDIKLKYPQEYALRGENLAHFAPKQGESFLQCQIRAVHVLQSILKTTKGNIVICSHAGFFRSLLCYLQNIDLNRMFEITLDYASISILSYEDSKVTIEGINQKSI